MNTVVAMMSLVGALGISSAAMAEWDGQGNSTPGADRYVEISANANPDAQCGTGGGSGAFGFLGKGLNPGDPIWDGGNGTDPGTSGLQTGLNNSGVCGNRQGNLPN